MAFESIDVYAADTQDFIHRTSSLLRISVPFAAGALWDTRQIAVEVCKSRLNDVQTRVLHRWPDGSVKWCLLQWLQPPKVSDIEDTARIVFRVPNVGDDAAPSVYTNRQSVWQVGNGSDAALHWTTGRGRVGLRSRLVTSDGGEFWGSGETLNSCETGPVVVRNVAQWLHLDASGARFPLETKLSIEYLPQLSAAVFRITIRNPRAADHPGGNWDLGNGGSVFLKDWSIEFSLPESFVDASVMAVCEPGVCVPASKSLKLFQASSGGENWRSTNHIDKDRQVSLPFRGYRAKFDRRSADKPDLETETVEGMRATPQVVVAGDQATFALAMRRFWENFPKAIDVTNRTVRLSLFPADSSYPHEIQGGEQKTHEFAVYFGDPADHAPLDWYLHPAQPQLDPEYYAKTGAIPYLTPLRSDPNDAHHALVESAIEGDDTFAAKRERIDEYGWRNFGDIYGDHEAVYHDGPTPLISHYNNQYDCTGGFAWQFFRTSDYRWFDQMVTSADHVWDIDTYHTDDDKSLYNHGLFWHTYHYADADTANHRSYPRRLTRSHLMPGGKDLENLGRTGETLAKNYAVGGGPAASQNYSTGWMWAYYLTGQSDYRDAAISAADYVVAIEEGRRTIFRWLSRADTGYASESSVGYHGPGRASGNSLHALLTGYELTDDNAYLMAAEKLIRRVAHPAESIDSLDLGNAELRWFYTMYLQALTRYLDVKRERGQNDESHAYAIATLNHFADWMSENERPTLDHAERLQYPTETWVAQDMRKWHVLQYAAWLSGEHPRRAKLLQEKADFFYDYVCTTLTQMPTRTLCRPVILMMQFGWQREWFKKNPKPPARLPDQLFSSFPFKEQFTPQRTIAMRRAKLLLVAAAVGFAALTVSGLLLLLNR